MHDCCLGGLRTVGVNFVPVAGPSMTSMMRISLLPAVSAAFLAAPLAGALLFGGIIVPSSPERLSSLPISGRDASLGRAIDDLTPTRFLRHDLNARRIQTIRPGRSFAVHGAPRCEDSVVFVVVQRLISP